MAAEHIVLISLRGNWRLRLVAFVLLFDVRVADKVQIRDPIEQLISQLEQIDELVL